jgi:hypothetical protein
MKSEGQTRWYWTIMRDTGDGPISVMAGVSAYASKVRARNASRRERMAHGWVMADGYYDLVEEHPATRS